MDDHREEAPADEHRLIDAGDPDGNDDATQGLGAVGTAALAGGVIPRGLEDVTEPGVEHAEDGAAMGDARGV